MAQTTIGVYDVLLNREVIATSKPCNPFSSGFRKGLQMLAEKNNVSISKLSWRRHREPVVRKSRIDFLVEEEERREAQQAQAQQAQEN